MAQLLTIETSIASLWIEGPATPSRGLQYDTLPTPGDMNIVLEGQCVLVHCMWLGMDGVSHRDSDRGPALFEETPYRMTVTARDNATPVSLLHRDPRLIEGVRPVAGRSSVLCGVINFGSQVGRTRIQVATTAGSFSFDVEVFPSKLDYESDYRALLGELTASARALVLEYLRATFQGALSVEGKPTALDWVLMVREEAGRLEQALESVFPAPV